MCFTKLSYPSDIADPEHGTGRAHRAGVVSRATAQRRRRGMRRLADGINRQVAKKSRCCSLTTTVGIRTGRAGARYSRALPAGGLAPRPGDAILSDNRALVHRGVNDYGDDDIRHMYRTTIEDRLV